MPVPNTLMMQPDPMVMDPNILSGTTPEPTPEQIAKDKERQDRYNNLFIFSNIKARLTALLDTWSSEITATEVRRKTRNIDIDVKGLRSNGSLKPDETIVPMRIIESNIRREQPPFMSYLKQSRRIATFKCLSNPKQDDVEVLEEDFTRGMTYNGWELPYYKCLDGSQTHGWDSVEVVFDDTKPLHVAIEHIGHEKLIYPKESTNIQTAEVLLRTLSLSQSTLRQFVATYNFDATQAEKVLQDKGAQGDKDKNVTIYKCFYKWDGVVYVAWFSKVCDDWLKAPEKLYLGRVHTEQSIENVPSGAIDPLTGQSILTQQIVPKQVPTDETTYPIFILPYNETERQEIFEHKGRVFLDKYKQEAQTAIASGFVNKLTRAANVYASVRDNANGNTGAPKQLDVNMEHGTIMDRPVDFWHTDYPDFQTLQAMQWFDVHNSQEVGQFDFAASNRKDSRKTATEIQTANQQSQLLNGTQLTLFSIWIREIMTFAWLIVQSQALQNKITLCLVDQSEQGEGQGNDVNVIAQVYDVRAAGDIDVVQRAEKLQRMQQFWPIVSTTALAVPFLKIMLKVAFPEDGEVFAEMLQQSSQDKDLIKRLAGMVQVLVAGNHGEDVKNLQPQEQQQMQQIMTEVQQSLAQPA